MRDMLFAAVLTFIAMAIGYVGGRQDERRHIADSQIVHLLCDDLPELREPAPKPPL